MSWLARSIASSLRLEEHDDDHGNIETDKNNDADKAKYEQHIIDSSPSSPISPGRGVKEDLSELTKTLTRQFWGVASFLAPPPVSEQSPVLQHYDSESGGPSGSPENSDPEVSDAVGVYGLRSDFAEIGGKFRSGISKLSNNVAMSEITKMASNFLQLGSDEDDFDSARGSVGVTEEVVAFARAIAMHPETWLDFPLPFGEDDEDFNMSDVQQEHALAVEHLAPRLAALRIELCPGYMSESCFWTIYFVLLHPRLDRHDAELLSTPQIVKARALLTQELQNHNKAKAEQIGSTMDTFYQKDINNAPLEELPSNAPSESVLGTSALESYRSRVATDVEKEKHPVQSTEIQIIDKSVIEEEALNQNKDQILLAGFSSKGLEDKDEDDADDWLKEESSEIAGASGTNIPIENEEDVSFSDLEEDDGDVPISYKKVTYCSDSSTKDSRDWVQLSRSSAGSSKDINSMTIEQAGSGKVSAHKPETKESSDWLDVDDIDVA